MSQSSTCCPQGPIVAPMIQGCRYVPSGSICAALAAWVRAVLVAGVRAVVDVTETGTRAAAVGVGAEVLVRTAAVAEAAAVEGATVVEEVAEAAAAAVHEMKRWESGAAVWAVVGFVLTEVSAQTDSRTDSRNACSKSL